MTKRIITIALLLTAVFFISVGGLVAQHEASPSSPKPQAQRERLSEKAGVCGTSTRTTGPVPTVVPSPEYRQLPSYDFAPKRMRATEEREV